MKKASKKLKVSDTEADEEILPEYSFRGAQRNPYATRYTEGSTVVVLDPDVAVAFPTAVEVNDALRTLATLIGKHAQKAASRTSKNNRIRKRPQVSGEGGLDSGGNGIRPA